MKWQADFYWQIETIAIIVDLLFEIRDMAVYWTLSSTLSLPL